MGYLFFAGLYYTYIILLRKHFVDVNNNYNNIIYAYSVLLRYDVFDGFFNVIILSSYYLGYSIYSPVNLSEDNAFPKLHYTHHIRHNTYYIGASNIYTSRPHPTVRSNVEKSITRQYTFIDYDFNFVPNVISEVK